MLIIKAEPTQRLTEIVAEIRASVRRTGFEVVTIGQLLLEAKSLVPHGQFATWVETHFMFTRRTAENFMNVAQRLAGKSEIISHLPPTILYSLAAPSTPVEAINQVLDRLQEGAPLQPADVKQIIVDKVDQAIQQAVKSGERAGRKVAEEVLATGGYVSVGGESVAMDAAITEEMAETRARQTQHIVDGYARKTGVSNDVKYQGSATVLSVDAQGHVTLLAPELTLEQGQQVTYVVYVKAGTNESTG